MPAKTMFHRVSPAEGQARNTTAMEGNGPCFLSRSNTAGSYGASMSLYSGRFIHASEMYRLTLAYRDLGIRNLFSFNGCEGDES